MAANEKVVNLVIRAVDEYSRAINAAKSKVDALSQKGQGASNKNLNIEVSNLREKYAALGREIAENSKKLRDGKAATREEQIANRELAIQLVQTRAKAQEVKAALDAKTAALHRAKGAAQGSFASFSKNADAMDVSAAKADRLQREIAQTEAQYKTATAAAQKYSTAISRQVGSGVAAGNGMVDTRFIASREQAGLDQSIEAAGAAKRRMIELRAELAKTNGAARGSFAAFDKIARSMQTTSTEALQLAPAVEQVVTETNQLGAAQDRVASKIDKTTAALKRQQRAAMGGVGGGAGNAPDAFDTFTRRSATRQQRGGLLNLRPYEYTNLGYQVNDVVSGLAMGQNPLQIFAQQFGQFAQLFPDAMAKILRFTPVLAGLIPIVVGLNRQFEKAQSVKFFTAQLALSADGSRMSAQAMADAATQIGKYTSTIDEARKITMDFAKLGIKPEAMGALVKMADQLAKITGETVPEAAARLGQAFTGNVDDVRKLDEELNFLTDTQLRQIRAMADAGDETEALSTAQEILAEKLQSTVQPASTWETALKDLKTAWNELIEALENSGIIDLAALALQGLALSARGTAAVLKAAASALNPKDVKDAGVAEQYMFWNKKVIELKAQLEDLRANQVAVANGFTDENSPAFQALNAELAEAIANLEEVKKKWREGEAASRDAAAAAGKNTDETNAKKKAQDDANRAVDAMLEKMRAELQFSAQSNRDQFIEKGLLEAINVIKEEGGTLDATALANLKERLGILYDMQEASKSSADFLSGNMGTFAQKIAMIESGGNPNAVNNTPGATATGLGGFIESTWVSLFKKYFPTEAANMSRDAILELRKNSDWSLRMIDVYAQENAKVLRAAGVSVNEVSLRLAHFLGPQGAAGVMAAVQSGRGATPVADILSADAIRMNPRELGGGKTAADVVARAAQQMNISPEQIAGMQALADGAEALNQSMQDAQFALEQTHRAEREAAIAEAVRNAEKAKGVALTEAELAKVKEIAGATYDAANQERLLNEQVQLLVDKRELLLEQLNRAQATGDTAGAAAIQQQITDLLPLLDQAIAKAEAFYRAMGGPEGEKGLLGLQKIRASLQSATIQIGINAEQINRSLADVGVDAFRAFAQAIAEGTNAWQAFKNAALQSLANVILKIGEAIVQAAILNALTGGTGTITGGVGGTVMGWIGRIFHDGGIVGGSAPSRTVSPSAFIGAARYHSGGIAGLKPNEVPAILQKGEEVLTADDPRHQNNGGGMAGGNTSIINAVDGTSFLEEALKKSDGRKVILNYIRANQQSVRAALGV